VGVAAGRRREALADYSTAAGARKLAAMTSDSEAATAKIEADIEALKPRLRDTLAAWLDATAPWVAGRWEETLETAIAYNPDAVKALGDEKRKALKERTTKMIASPRPLVEKRLVEEHPEAWPHLRGPDDRWDPEETFATKTERVGSRKLQTTPSEVSSLLESVLSDMGDLLEGEGFNLVRFLPGSAFSRSQRPRVAAGPSLAWSDQMMRTMNAYGQLTTAYVGALKELEKVQAERARSEAEELWGKA